MAYEQRPCVDLQLQNISDYEGGTRKQLERVRPRVPGTTSVPAEPPPASPFGHNVLNLGINFRCVNPDFCMLTCIIDLRNNQVPNTTSTDGDDVRNEVDPMPSKKLRLSALTQPEQQQALKPAHVANNNNGRSDSVPGIGRQTSKMRRVRAADKRTMVALRRKLLHRADPKERKKEDNELVNAVRCVHSDGVPRSHEGNLPNFDLLDIVHK